MDSIPSLQAGSNGQTSVPVGERGVKRPRQIHAVSESRSFHHDPSLSSASLPHPVHPGENRVTISSLVTLHPLPSEPVVTRPVKLPKMHEILRQSLPIPASSTSQEVVFPPKPSNGDRLALHYNSGTAASTLRTRDHLQGTSISELHYNNNPQYTLPSINRYSRIGKSVPHTKQKMIPCPYDFCDKTFSRNSNLKGKYFASITVPTKKSWNDDMLTYLTMDTNQPEFLNTHHVYVL